MVKNIIIFGFRYTGKSTIGKLVAEKLGWEFFDIDSEIKNRTGKTIDILTNYGVSWYEFRKIEYEICKELILKQNVVISCGGGFGVNDIDSLVNGKTFGELEVDLILESIESCRVFLDIDERTLIQRISLEGKRTRTSIFGNNNDDIEDIIKEDLELYTIRKPLYGRMEFDFSIFTNNFINPAFYSQKIVKKFEVLQNIKRSAIIGEPVTHSLSPTLHNACYRALSVDDKFDFIKFKMNDFSIENAKNLIISKNFNGISVTSPYKELALKIVDESDDFSKKIGAVNTILNKNGKLYGYNTDYIGVLMPLKDLIGEKLKDKKVAIFGSGGAAKSAVIGLSDNVLSISLFNRTKEKNDSFALKNNTQSNKIEDFIPENFDIIINATTVGLNSNESILNESQILKDHIVFDMVYSPYETKLLEISKNKGATIIHGTEMLIHQGVEQFKIYTGLEPEIRVMRNVIDKKFLTDNNLNPYKLCVVVYGSNKNELIQRLKHAQEISNFIEIRADYIEHLNESDILEIALELRVKAIFTCRMKKFGGKFNGSEKDNIKLLEYAFSLNLFEFFDIDLENAENFHSLTQKNPEKIILSWHEFDKNPNESDLKIVLERMRKFKPAAYKLAFKSVENDWEKSMIKNLLEEAKSTDVNLIIAPMGSSDIRKLAETFGSWSNFYALSQDLKTALGQMVLFHK